MICASAGFLQPSALGLEGQQVDSSGSHILLYYITPISGIKA